MSKRTVGNKNINALTGAISPGQINEEEKLIPMFPVITETTMVQFSQHGVHLPTFIQQTAPEVAGIWSEIISSKGEYANNQKILNLCSRYEQIIAFIASKIASGEYTFYQQSASYLNEQTSENFTNLARNVKLLLFHLQSAAGYVSTGADKFEMMQLDLQASLLTNGHFDLDLVGSLMEGIEFSPDIPRHLVKQIVIYLKAIKKECFSRKSHNKSELVFKMLDVFINLLSFVKP